PGAHAAPGDAIDLLLLPALATAFRLHVSFRRDAALGAVAPRDLPADAFPAVRARAHAERCRSRRHRHRGVLADRLRAALCGDRPDAVPEHAGLTRRPSGKIVTCKKIVTEIAGLVMQPGLAPLTECPCARAVATVGEWW